VFIIIKINDYENEKSKTDTDYYKWDGAEKGLLVGVGYHY